MSRVRVGLLRAIAVGALLAPTFAWSAVSPSPIQSATPVPSATASPVSGASKEEGLSAHAAAERTKMYKGGLAYGRWLKRLAVKSGNDFLQRPVFDRVVWIDLIACLGSLILLGIFTGWFLWFVRRCAGAIEAQEHQSWLALAAAAIRKPFALMIWVIGGFLAFMPIVAGISDRSTRVMFVDLLTALLYAGRVIAILWLIFQGIRAVEKRMRHWAQRSAAGACSTTFSCRCSGKPFDWRCHS